MTDRIITTTETYEDRPFWQVLVMIVIVILTAGLTILGLFWVASQMFPDYIGYSDSTTEVFQSSQGQYIKYSDSHSSQCLMNGIEVNCSNISQVIKW
jgi:hypothetical protein